jgi:hypothetical protein
VTSCAVAGLDGSARAVAASLSPFHSGQTKHTNAPSLLRFHCHSVAVPDTHPLEYLLYHWHRHLSSLYWFIGDISVVHPFVLILPIILTTE